MTSNLILPPLVSKTLFNSLIVTASEFVKKKKSKMRHLKKFVKPMAVDFPQV